MVEEERGLGHGSAKEQQLERKESREATIGEEAAAAKDATDATSGREASADVVLIARQFMREPEWTLRVASQLGVDVAWPSQFLRVRFPKL